MHLPRQVFLFLATFFLCVPLLSADTLSYQFDINTSSLDGTAGFLDIQFNPGPSADAAEASVFAFSTDGTLYSSPLAGNSGDATGTLPGDLTLQNDTVFNDVFTGIDFGTIIQFDVTFSGIAVTNPSATGSGSTFSVGLYDSTASNPLLTSDPSGALAIVNVGPDGSIVASALPDENGGPSDATITPLGASPIPEPASFVLLLTGCGALFLIGTRRKRVQSALTLFAVFGALGVSAHASPQIYLSTSATASANARSAASPADSSATCPSQGGIVQVVSVPVANTVTLSIVVGDPSPITTTFQIVSTNTAIVGGSQNQGFIPQVTLQAGATQSSPFNIYGQSIGQSTLTATDLSGYYGTLVVPVTSWDLNAGDSVNKLIDTNPPTNSCVTSGGLISQDPSVLAVCGASAKGVATDGITTLLLRLSAAFAGTGCYSITSTSSLDQGTVQYPVTTTQAAGGWQEAFSFYSAPVYYGDTSASRTVQFTFSYTPSQSLGNGNTSSFTANLTVVRPPVVLIHGVWSNGGSWPNFYLKNDQNHWTYAADYAATNASSYSVNFPQVQSWVQHTLNLARGSGIAVTQVDVIAHSMGGILTRLYASSNNFMRPDNLNQGDIRRLVTLDTPHLGSSFANLIVGLHNYNAATTEATVASITGGGVTQGAVCDLSENSLGLAGLDSSTPLTGMVVTATNGPPGSPTSPALYWGGFLGSHSFEAALTKQTCVQSGLFGCKQYGPYVFPQATVNGFRFRQANDTVVGLSSQQGGITGGTNYPNLIHSGFRWAGINFVAAVNNNSGVATQVYTLLDQSNSSFVTSFPSVNSFGTGAPVTVPGRGNGLDVQDWAAQCGPGGPMQPNAAANALPASASTARAAAVKKAAASASPLVQITSPTAGQSFANSQTITVNVQVDASLNATDGILFTTGLDEYSPTSFSATNFTVSIPVPNYFTGPVTLTPAVSDINGNLTFGSPVTIGIQSSVAPTSVYLSEHNYYLSPSDGSQQLHLIGNFPDSVQLDLTSAESGTTYASSNLNVITVDSEGNFTIAGTGIASVTATNSGLSDYAVFVVQNPLNPLPPLDVTNSASIKISGFTLNRQTGFFVGNLIISASGSAAVPGPIYALLNGLPSGVSLVDSNGITVNTNAGTPYLSLTLPGQGLIFAPGQSVTLPVQFLNPNRVLIKFTPSLIRTSQNP
jgi:pimeloyl-ACP methyl ester carboxylesterase